MCQIMHGIRGSVDTQHNYVGQDGSPLVLFDSGFVLRLYNTTSHHEFVIDHVIAQYELFYF